MVRFPERVLEYATKKALELEGVGTEAKGFQSSEFSEGNVFTAD